MRNFLTPTKAYLALVLIAFPLLAEPVILEIRLDGELTQISPLIYGLNDWNRDESTEVLNYTLERMGGNRMTGYNWENNYSNAGNDYIHHSDGGLVSQAAPADRQKPGMAVRLSVDHARSGGRPSLVTLQLAGYVAADSNGSVSETDTAPSARWKEVVINKEGELSLTPDLTDGFVYLDEQVNFLIHTYGTSAGGGVFAYSLDNEPAVWPFTHERIHPERPTVEEIVTKGANAAAMVKSLDPDALIFGPALYGWGAYVDFSAPDWSSYSSEYDWFLSAYLAEMKKRSDLADRRLLDVLDIHYYPEVSVVTGKDSQNNDIYTRITDSSNNSENVTQARLQAPRSLWDNSYVEESWVTTWSTGGQPIKLFPRVFESIETQNPGTKLAITEYNFGGAQNYSGGLAQADVLGIYGRDGLYAACFWGDVDGYIVPGFNIYRDYDGQGSTFGDISIPSNSSDGASFSCYASIDSGTGNLHLVAINKTGSAHEAVLDFTDDFVVFERMKAFGFSEATGPNIEAMGTWDRRFTSQIETVLPARSVTHFILESPARPYDTQTLQGIDENGNLELHFRPSVGKTSILRYSDNLSTWTDPGQKIPGDGQAREIKLTPEGNSNFWRLEKTEE